MKICVVIGSGKVGGNTEKLADAFIKGAQEAGHEVEKLHLGKLKIGPCVGCNGCKAVDACVQEDDFPVFEAAFRSCDALVLTTPLYFWGISGQLKCLIDRLYSIGEKDPKGYYFVYPKKKCAMLCTGADSDRHFWAFEEVEHYYRRLVSYMHWTDLGILNAGSCGGSGVLPRRIEETPHLQRAYEFGKQLR